LHDKNNSEKSRQNLINEVCDLFYHSLVLLAKNQINLSEVFEEFNKRNNQ
jgi:phosphoribosyl-ATP pyrophosphohydrolase